jgi:hypothetical protein
MKIRNVIYIILFSATVIGCSNGSDIFFGENHSVQPSYRYKYDIRLPDKNGIERYYFSFRRNDILRLGGDGKIAILKFIELRKAEPIECAGTGIRIYKNGENEGGGIWAIIECLDSP